MKLKVKLLISIPPCFNSVHRGEVPLKPLKAKVKFTL